jgi:uncharacterized membrane protein YdfJ with MMPL/SSD domain
VLLVVLFRSLLIPLIAATMNILSAAAAFGVVTAIFQDGIGASLLGLDKTGPINAFVPVASAVLLDALVVRSVLVPALMLMFGDANWKLPRALARRLPHLRVEGAAVVPSRGLTNVPAACGSSAGA